ncbi:MAG: hypothetical protein H7329_02650 [Opitutaceae bacterium]|nr:hypothetical protein [Cytophagales bacterium]
MMKLRVLFGVAGLALVITASAQTALIKKLDRYSSIVSQESDLIPASRKEQLTSLADMIISANLKDGNSSLIFTDETNSGVSQIAQAFLQASIAKKGLAKVNIFSAGNTESAIDKQAIELLKSAGFSIECNTNFKKNPHYLLNYSWSENRIMLFSKKMDNFQIPATNLIVVSLDGNSVNDSPAINNKQSIPYGVVNETTLKEIAREMFFIAEKVQNNQLLSHQQ